MHDFVVCTHSFWRRHSVLTTPQLTVLVSTKTYLMTVPTGLTGLLTRLLRYVVLPGRVCVYCCVFIFRTLMCVHQGTPPEWQKEEEEEQELKVGYWRTWCVPGTCCVACPLLYVGLHAFYFILPCMFNCLLMCVHQGTPPEWQKEEEKEEEIYVECRRTWCLQGTFECMHSVICWSVCVLVGGVYVLYITSSTTTCGVHSDKSICHSEEEAD
jgi:hypothetical protein